MLTAGWADQDGGELEYFFALNQPDSNNDDCYNQKQMNESVQSH
jgi:beta-lactamase class D